MLNFRQWLAEQEFKEVGADGEEKTKATDDISSGKEPDEEFKKVQKQKGEKPVDDTKKIDDKGKEKPAVVKECDSGDASGIVGTSTADVAAVDSKISITSRSLSRKITAPKSKKNAMLPQEG